jgi:hypothetical protein
VRKKLPYATIARAAVQHAHTAMPPRGMQAVPSQVWAIAAQGFRAGARYGYRLAKERRR